MSAGIQTRRHGHGWIAWHGAFPVSASGLTRTGAITNLQAAIRELIRQRAEALLARSFEGSQP